jgi:hypothetical protein
VLRQTKRIEITACDQLLENGAKGSISINGGVLNKRKIFG